MTFPRNVDGQVFINGVDVTDYVRPMSVRITSALTNQVDTFKCTLDDPPFSPRDWQEVIVYDGAVKEFGGYIQTHKEKNEDTDLNYEVNASDWSIRFAHVIVKEEYENTTDKDIIADLFTKYLPSEGFDFSTYVEAVKLHDRKRFNREKLLDVLKELAKDAGCDWYPDPDKNIHFFKNELNYAPFNVSDNPDGITTMPYSRDVVDTDGAGVVNRVEVVGGTYLSEDATFYLQGTGIDSRIIVPFGFHAPAGETSVLIYRNDGTYAVPVWTPLTVKVGYIDTLVDPDDVLYYYNEKVIEQSNPFPNLMNAIKIVGKYDVPLRERVVDVASYHYYGDRWFDDKIVRPDLTSKLSAKMVGKTKLADNAMSKRTISFEIVQPGLRSGQIIKFTNSKRVIDTYFLIQKVTGSWGIDGKANYSVDVGIYNPNFIDFVIALNRKMSSESVWRDDEVLDEILQAAETLTVVEVASLSTSQPPYYFSPDPAEAFDWGFGTFDPP